jgi:AcrR family transcriptional regulator
MRDGEATRSRILCAATDEFAARGIAGARVDRIAAAAAANKAQMYAYFGSKEGLFDAVLQAHNEAILDNVPLAADDLPGYAVRLYDDYLKNADLLRLAMWRRLERVPEGDLLADMAGHDDAKLAAIAQAQRDGHVDPSLHPADVLALVIALSLTWSPVSVTHAATAGDDAAEHDRRRQALAQAVRRAITPDS